ncbi:MAG: hypothetical protein Fur0039_07150 [Rhodocyclaceae bacterium]
MNLEDIRAYWEARAEGDDSPQATTQDVFLRAIEQGVLAERIRSRAPRSVADVGCGDGRTTIGLARRFPDIRFFGLDYATAMIDRARKVACTEGVSNASFCRQDLRDGLGDSFDLAYSTRCLINLPSWDLQMDAVAKIHAALAPGGSYLMIENFVEGHDNFNRIRHDFGLPEIPIRKHNLYFARDRLLHYARTLFDVVEELNISSTYYLVSRVVYSRICADAGAEPDYFDAHHRYAASLPFCGEYGPVRLIAFQKKRER